MDVAPIVERECEIEEQIQGSLAAIPTLSPIRFDVIAVRSCSSTMELADEILSGETPIVGVSGGGDASDSAPIIRCGIAISRTQSTGRGRSGRRWDSAREGVYLTVSAITRLAAKDLYGLAPALGVDICETLKRYDVRCGLKWPNDIWGCDHEGSPVGKLAGVLIEAKGDNPTRISVGVGVNLAGNFNGESFRGVSLAELGSCVLDYGRIGADLSVSIVTGLLDFCSYGFGGVRNRFLALSLLSGRAIRATEGSNEVRGIVAGVTDQGALIVKSKDRTITLSASEVHVEDWA